MFNSQWLTDSGLTEGDVLNRLRIAVARERATHFFLLLLDGAWSGEARAEAAATLATMLDSDKEQAITNLLFSLPLPPGESVQSALLLCSGTRVRTVLTGRPLPARGRTRLRGAVQVLAFIPVQAAIRRNTVGRWWKIAWNFRVTIPGGAQ